MSWSSVQPSATVGLRLTIGTATVLLAVAAFAEDPMPAAFGSTWQIGDAEVLVPTHPAGAPVSSVEPVEGADLLHVSFAPISDAPDARNDSWLFDPDRGELVTTWTEREPSRILAFDIDGDGDNELVRDLDRPAPCGLFVWWRPAVLTDGEFVPVATTPRTAEARQSGSIAPPRPGVQTELIASTGEHAATIGALIDGDAATAWTADRDGAGTWVAIEAPLGARVGGIRLAADDATGPLVVRVRFGDGNEAMLEVDRSLREYPIATESRCAVVEAAELGGRARMSLTEASLVTSTDGLTPGQLVRQFWLPALEASCAPGDHPSTTVAVASRAARADADALGLELWSTDDPCVARAIVGALDSYDVDGRLRLDVSLSQVAAEEAQSGHYGPGAIARLAELRTEDAGWSEALRSAAVGATEPLPLDEFLVAATRDESVTSDALALASEASTVELSTLVGGTDDIARWQRALRIAHQFRAPCSEADVTELSDALAHENGTVARLALHVIGARQCHALTDAVRAIIQDDPSPPLRSSAITTLGRLGASSCELPRDPAPNVRAVQAAAECAPAWIADEPSRLTDALDGEPWPDVRAAWVASAIAADTARVDEAAMTILIEGAPDDDVVAAFSALRVRGTRVPTEAIDVMIARDGSRAVLTAGIALLPLVDDLPTQWLESLPTASGYSEQLQPAIDALLAR